MLNDEHEALEPLTSDKVVKEEVQIIEGITDITVETQCIAVKGDGDRCKRARIKNGEGNDTGFCWYHYTVLVGKKSIIPGGKSPGRPKKQKKSDYTDKMQKSFSAMLELHGEEILAKALDNVGELLEHEDPWIRMQMTRLAFDRLLGSAKQSGKLEIETKTKVEADDKILAFVAQKVAEENEYVEAEIIDDIEVGLLNE